MRASQILSFQETTISLLRRPWKPERDGTLFYGQEKTGNKRLPLSTKQGNKNFYKGTRSSGIGYSDSRGKYHIKYQKVRTFVAPPLDVLRSCPLKPLVSSNVAAPKNSFSGYTDATDGRLMFDKVKEFILTGTVEYPKLEDNIERG